jgi:hypothetical protein
VTVERWLGKRHRLLIGRLGVPVDEAGGGPAMVGGRMAIGQLESTML